jgi:hypothetical protein
MVAEYSFQSSQMPAKATHREAIIFVHTLMSYSCKGKGKFSLKQATKAQNGSRCITVLFL